MGVSQLIITPLEEASRRWVGVWDRDEERKAVLFREEFIGSEAVSVGGPALGEEPSVGGGVSLVVGASRSVAVV